MLLKVSKALKPILRGKVGEKKACFILEAGVAMEVERQQIHVQRPTHPAPTNQWIRSFIGGVMYRNCTVSSDSCLQFGHGLGLISIILIVLRTVSLRFQDQFVPISLRSCLGNAAVCVMATIWSSRS